MATRTAWSGSVPLLLVPLAIAAGLVWFVLLAVWGVAMRKDRAWWGRWWGGERKAQRHAGT